MQHTPDYSRYSLKELQQARDTIDVVEYPERANELDRLIAQHQPTIDTHASPHKILTKAQVKFHGNTSEYFSIWIVNLMLTIVTLGIYSAWATVRNNRYFYGNTEIDGHRFSYLAEPLQILKGRVVAVVLFAGYFIASALNPVVAVFIGLGLFAAMPFLVVWSMRFKMRMTAYRNVRFNFKGNYGRAFLLFVVLPIVSVFTLHLMLPWVLKSMDEFLLDERGYGDRKFDAELSTGEYYATGFGSVLIGIVLMIIFSFLMGGVMTATQSTSSVSVMTVVMFAFYLVAYAIVYGFYKGRIRNHIFSHSKIDGVATFDSSIAIGDLILLYITNTIAVVCTLGFAIPWAKVRMAHFFANATQVTLYEGMNEVVAGDSGDASAIAEETATLFDVDIALG